MTLGPVYSFSMDCTVPSAEFNESGYPIRLKTLPKNSAAKVGMVVRMFIDIYWFLGT